ncbi:MAG: hypothetical protein CTY37_05470 [Methylotenera sp.]|jgi:predicted nuclease of restriction endonuclease-like (RecB) superfamily|nr:MAG: hypothetical protein CTY37_05470 [Methylotenera sp.]
MRRCTIAHDAVERDVELGLIDYISKFRLEFGKGFAYMGPLHWIPVARWDVFALGQCKNKKLIFQVNFKSQLM